MPSSSGEQAGGISNMALTVVKLKLSLYFAFNIEPFLTVFQCFDVLFTFGFREILLF